jgi:glycosyltransferase involved in cell wall biosynthesis
MVPTTSLAQKLDASGFLRLKVVPRGVDLQLFDPAHRSDALRNTWGAQADTPVILCVSRLASEKNLQLLVRAYAQAKLVRPDVRLVLVGDGPARAELRGLAPDAIFAGVQTGQSLSTHYASADIFGFPSKTETFGNVVLEGMSSGLAVVAFDYAAAAETILHGQNGLLARLNDEEGFVQRVVELTVEADRVSRLRKAARVTVQTCDWQQIVAQVEAVMYQATLGGPLYA